MPPFDATCQAARLWISADLDGEATERERHALAQHLATCEGCRVFAACSGSLVLRVRTAAPVPAGPLVLVAPPHAKPERTRPRPERRLRRPGGIRMRTAAAALTAAAAVFAGAFVVGSSALRGSSTPETAAPAAAVELGDALDWVAEVSAPAAVERDMIVLPSTLGAFCQAHQPTLDGVACLLPRGQATVSGPLLGRRAETLG